MPDESLDLLHPHKCYCYSALKQSQSFILLVYLSLGWDVVGWFISVPLSFGLGSCVEMDDPLLHGSLLWLADYCPCILARGLISSHCRFSEDI